MACKNADYTYVIRRLIFSWISPEIKGLIANIISALHKQQKLRKMCQWLLSWRQDNL